MVPISLSVCETAYNAITFKSLTVFECVPYTPTGSAMFLKVAPGINCWSHTHLLMCVCAVLSLLGTTIGLPAFYFLTMKRAHAQGYACSRKFLDKYLFFFGRYRVGCQYWGVCLLCQRLLFVLMVVVLGQTRLPHVQAAGWVGKNTGWPLLALT